MGKKDVGKIKRHEVITKKEPQKFLKLLLYPEEYLFSNQFMEDLGKIYRLKKYFPSFEDG